MSNTDRKKWLKALFSIMIIVCVIFNPLTHGSGDIKRINMFFTGINSILESMGIGFIIKSNQMVDSIIFTEYLLWGISLATVTKAFFGKVLVNITKPLSIGLILAILISYHGYLSKGMISGIGNLVTMLLGLLFGLTIYLLFDVVRSIFLSKIMKEKTKYRRSR